jgi:rfaE bifunctional protein kinase chain/domain
MPILNCVIRNLENLLSLFPSRTILVVGDFFLDKYLILERMLTEKSLETGLDAYQVVAVRAQPGAAGTVTSNLRALEVQTIGLGVVGEDGQGFELLRGLEATGVEHAAFVTARDWFTPTYTKPMMREPDGRMHELNRLDIKNRAPLPRDVEDAVIARLNEIVPRVDGVIAADQVPERNCGVITDRVRAEIARLAREFPQKIFAADSRERIGEFREVIVKPNVREATRAVWGEEAAEIGDWRLEKCARELYARTGRGVVITLGERGMLVYDSRGAAYVPTIKPEGEIDIVGAGDAAMAGLVSALCAGADLRAAALVGNLCAAVTIRQIGTTGTATRAQVRAMAKKWDTDLHR